MCTAAFIGWDTATPPAPHPIPRYLGSYTRAVLVRLDRRHLFVTPWDRVLVQFLALNRFTLFSISCFDLNLRRHQGSQTAFTKVFPQWCQCFLGNWALATTPVEPSPSMEEDDWRWLGGQTGSVLVFGLGHRPRNHHRVSLIGDNEFGYLVAKGLDRTREAGRCIRASAPFRAIFYQNLYN